jgi:ABC-2 type transport system ATP-binding protein
MEITMHTSQSINVVETTGLTKRFDDKVVVDNVDLRIPRGSAFGYLGPNGAGKTTLIRMLLGLTEPSSGSMSLLGLPVPVERTEALARVGAIVDEPRFHGHMTGRQNLSVIAAAREPAAHGRIGAALARVGLAERADDAVSKYSMGMRQRLGIASCLLADPELLILDEPMNGLDPAGMQEFRELIRSFVGEGMTVVLSSHLLDEVERTCDAVAIVDRGRVVVQGSIEELASGQDRSLQLSTSDPDLSGLVAAADPAVTSVSDDAGRVVVALRPDASAERAAATISRSLIEAGVDVYELEISHASLEQRFLEITSRLGVAA